MNIKDKVLFIIVVVTLFFASCNSSQNKQTEEVLIAPISKVFHSLAILPIADEIESVEYIPLATTDDDASLIDGVVDFAITSNSIYVLLGREPRIVQFNRQGNFLGTFIQQGQGPGEFNGMICFIQADEAENRFYVIGINKIGVFTLDGKFVEDCPINSSIVYAHHLGNGHVGAVAMPFMPFQNGSFGIGVFRENGELVMNKNDFHSSLVPQESAGFTFGVTGSPSDGEQQSILFKMAGNDTIFRLTADAIHPALVTTLGNSDEEVIRGLNTQEMKKTAAENDIFVSDMFETFHRFYLRMKRNEKFYVASVDKRSGETVVERCDIPERSGGELADLNMQMGMLGTKGYNNFPIWGRIIGDRLVQVVSPYELEVFKEQTKINIPKELENIDANENPIFIVYKMKNSINN